MKRGLIRHRKRKKPSFVVTKSGQRKLEEFYSTKDEQPKLFYTKIDDYLPKQSTLDYFF